MSATTLAAAAAVDALVALVLVYVGWTVAIRPASAEGRRALHAFGVWWIGLAITVAINATKEGFASAGILAPAFFVALQYVWVAALCAAVWGLLYYLIFLFTGHDEWYWRLALFYVAYGAAAAWALAQLQPNGIIAPTATEHKWFIQWSYANPSALGVVLNVLILLLLLPQIGAAVVYLRAAGRTKDKLARFRVRVVAWALILWLGLTLLAPFVQLGRFEAWQAGGRLVGLAASLAILYAYRPPAALRRRLEVPT